MTNVSRVAFLSTLCAFAFLPAAFAASAPAHQDHSSAKQPTRSAKAWQTSAALRDLWVEHVFWVRNVVLATFKEDAAAAKAAEQEAVANAKAIAGAIEPFYGTAAKDALFKLLAGHYGAVKAYLVSTVAGDSQAQSKAIEALTSNAGDIATFLSKANPHLPKDDVNGLLLAHGGHHIQQIQQLQGRDYVAEAKTWSAMKNHMYAIADAMTDALAKQFGKKF